MKRIKIITDKEGQIKLFVGHKEYGVVTTSNEDGLLIYTAAFSYELDALKTLLWKGDLYNFEEYINQKVQDVFDILNDDYYDGEV